MNRRSLLSLLAGAAATPFIPRARAGDALTRANIETAMEHLTIKDLLDPKIVYHAQRLWIARGSTFSFSEPLRIDRWT